MKATKYIVLAGGLVGLASFFLPLVSIQRDGFSGTASAFEVVRDASSDVASLKGIVMAIFAPAALLALLGGLGVMRRRFGRVAGTFALLSGLAGLGIAALLKSAAGGDGGIGLSLLLLTGATGIIGGVIALAKPERSVVAVAAEPASYGASLAPLAAAPARGAETVVRRVA